MAALQTSWTMIVGGIGLRILLLLAVLFQLGYLANEYSYRVDLTAEQIYTLTPATQRVLDKLEDTLVIEAYLSAEERLPLQAQPLRRQLVSLLEEYEELGQGRVVLRKYDPFTDTTLREKVERLGLKAQTSAISDKGSITAAEVWQGLRLRYGAKKERVIPFLRLQRMTAAYERQLTPLIKQLTVTDRVKVGVLAFRSRPGGGGLSIGQGPRSKPMGFTALLRAFGDLYDLRPIDLSKGALIPEDINNMILIRPKLLSDRTKFVLDQFLMRGGKLVVFADSAAEIEITPNKEIRANLVGYDGPGSKLSFAEQLKHYGIAVQSGIVGDGGDPSLWQTFVTVVGDPRTNEPRLQPLFNPFIFEPANQDWADKAEVYAKKANGEVDEVLAEQYRKLFKPGIEKDHELTEVLTRGGSQFQIPGFFWPCPVELHEPLPEGVKGQVLMRTSPMAWVDSANVPLDPFNGARDGNDRGRNLQSWTTARSHSIPRSNPSQIPLMAVVSGRFSSFFASRPVPLRPQDKKAAASKPKKNPLEEDWGEEKKKTPKPAAPEATQPLVSQESKISKAETTGTLLVIGDSDMLRDDFISGEYAQPRGPQVPLPLFGPADKGINFQAQPGQDRGRSRAVFFFKALLDWMAEERDLIELDSRVVVDRSMKLGELDAAAGETQEEFMERLQARQNSVQRWVLVLPILLLLAFGAFLLVKRTVSKRQFLSSL